MSNSAVNISKNAHLTLKELVKLKRKEGERSNNGLYVEQLIIKEARLKEKELKKNIIPKFIF